MFKKTKCFFLLNCIFSLANGMNQYHLEGRRLHHTRNQNGSNCSPCQVVLCRQNDFGLHPFPYDCNKYIQCEGGKTIIRDCDNGLSFNTQQEMCNTAHNINCQHHMTVNRYSENIERTSTISPVYDIEAVCNANSPPLRSHPRSCWKYIRCVQDISYIETCPPGHGFIAPFGKCMPVSNCVHVVRENTENYNNYGGGSNVNLGDQTSTSTGSSVQSGSDGHIRIASPSPYGSSTDERDKHIHQSTSSTAVFTTKADTTTATNTPYEELKLESSFPARNYTGSAQIKINGAWYYICHNKFNMNAANVFCREIGFQQGAHRLLKNSYFITTQILRKNKIEFSIFNEVVCQGNENSLKECEFINWDTNTCEADEVVGVVCKRPPKNRCNNDKFLCSTQDQCIPGKKICNGIADCSDLSDEKLPQCNKTLEYRLVNGKTRNEGRLQIKYQGIWGGVCDDDFGNMEAQTFCRSIGYFGPAIFSRKGFGLGYGPIWLARHRCTSIESNHDLADCSTGIYTPTNCKHSQVIRIRCTRSGALTTE